MKRSVPTIFSKGDRKFPSIFSGTPPAADQAETRPIRRSPSKKPSSREEEGENPSESFFGGHVLVQHQGDRSVAGHIGGGSKTVLGHVQGDHQANGLLVEAEHRSQDSRRRHHRSARNPRRGHHAHPP